MKYLIGQKYYACAESVYFVKYAPLCEWYIERYPTHKQALLELLDEGMFNEDGAQRICNPSDYAEELEDLHSWSEYM
jgi:hypothetical protein